MSDDLPNQNGNNGSNNNAVPASPVGGPPPFGSSFTSVPKGQAPLNSHSSPVNSNTPYPQQPLPISQNPPSSNFQPPLPNTPNFPNVPESPDYIKHEHYSEAAQHKPRDEHGHFVHTDTPTSPTPAPQGQVPLNPSSPSVALAKEGLPPIIEINQNTKPTDKKDPPLFGFFITNPVTYLKAFLSRLLKRQMITLRIPVLALIIIMAGVGGGVGGFGLGVKTGINYALGKLFPGFSPILHRSITAQGTIQKSSNGYYLQANDKNKTLWTLNPASANINLADFAGMRVQIKGNLTPTPNLIDVSEVISFDKINP